MSGAKEVVLSPDEYRVEGEERAGWFSRFSDWLSAKWEARQKRKADEKAYKQKLKSVENAVYQKKKMENDIEKAVEKGENRAKPFMQKVEEMSDKLKDVGEDNSGNKKQKAPLFGNLSENNGLNINSMFSNNSNDQKKRGGGLF